jgi:pimeloyl-ACP methyl ester carboxylesterase
MPRSTAVNPFRATLDLDGRRLSYLDFGGDGRPLLALHGHLDQGATFTALARELAPEWRVIAPDQRGHGESDRAPEYTGAGYLSDAVAVLDHVGVDRAVVLGHSLGGLNAYRLAARHPERVTALVIEDAGAEMGVEGGANPFLFLSGCPYEAATREELIAGLGPAGPMFADALRRLPDGTWRLPFHPQDMIESEAENEGDHWADWLASDCPALLLYGERSPVVSAALAEAMVRRRPGTRAVAIDADHFLHRDRPEAFTAAVRPFLRAPDGACG